MARNNGNAQRKPPIPLTLVDQGGDFDEEEETYIVVGEVGENSVMDICENFEIALGVREIMLEEGFAVTVYQAVEIEIVDDDEMPATGHAA